MSILQRRAALMDTIAAAAASGAEGKHKALDDFVSGNVPVRDLLLPLLTPRASTSDDHTQSPSAADATTVLEIYVRQTYRLYTIKSFSRYDLWPERSTKLP